MRYIALAAALLFFSCRDSIPSGVIKPDKMQAILWDMARADALSQEIAKRDSATTAQAEKKKLLQKVFLLHDITTREFEKSYSYYVNHPDIMRTMLDSITVQQSREPALQQNSELQVPASKIEVTDSLKKDSINNH